MNMQEILDKIPKPKLTYAESDYGYDVEDLKKMSIKEISEEMTRISNTIKSTVETRLAAYGKVEDSNEYLFTLKVELSQLTQELHKRF